MRSTYVWFLFMLSLLAASCGEDTLVGSSAIEGSVWRLGSLQRSDFSVVAITEPEQFTAQFGTSLAVKADCNQCGGQYQVNGEALSVGPMACTRAFCTATAPVDSLYVESLQAATSFGVTDGVLTVHSSKGTLRFTP